MVDAPVEVRVNRQVRKIFGSFALAALSTGLSAIAIALTGFAGEVRELPRLQPFVVTWFASGLPLAFGFVYFHRRRWSLESEGVRILGLFRHHEIPWSDVVALRIESFKEGMTYKLVLRESDGKVYKLNMAELASKGGDGLSPTEWELPIQVRGKTEFIKNSARNWGQLAAESVIGLVVIIFAVFLIMSMAPLR